MQLALRQAQGTAHWGILEAAKDLVSDLASEGVLAALLEGRPLPPNSAHRPAADCRCASLFMAGLAMKPRMSLVADVAWRAGRPA